MPNTSQQLAPVLAEKDVTMHAKAPSVASACASDADVVKAFDQSLTSSNIEAHNASAKVAPFPAVSTTVSAPDFDHERSWLYRCLSCHSIMPRSPGSCVGSVDSPTYKRTSPLFPETPWQKTCRRPISSNSTVLINLQHFQPYAPGLDRSVDLWTA
jgi:hypothetical protein